VKTNYETWTKDRLIALVYDQQATIDSLKVTLSDNMVLSVKDKFGLTLSEARVVTCLADGRVKGKRAIYEFVYHDEFDNPPEPHVIEVYLSKVRRKIFPFGLVVETTRDGGVKLVGEKSVMEIIDTDIEPIVPDEYVPLDRRNKGENDKAVHAALIANMKADGRVRISTRELSKASGLKVVLLPIMRRLAARGIIEVKGQPSRKDRMSLWDVYVKVIAL